MNAVAEPVQVIAVAGGEAGTGKTGAAVNLGVALGNRGRRVMLLDAALGPADIGHALGLEPRYGLGHVIRGERRLDEILLAGPSGVTVVPSAAAGSRAAEALTQAQSAGLIAAFSELPRSPEVLVVDTPAGVSEGPLRFVEAASEILLVIEDRPAATEGALALIRRLRQDAGHDRFRILVNRVAGETEGRAVCERLARKIESSVDVALHFAGSVPEDPDMAHAQARREPIVNAFPKAPAARAFKRLARGAETWAPPPHAGGLAFFVERMIARDTNIFRRTAV